MDTLPYELCDLIIKYIPPGRDRAAMAAVNHRFQFLVEPYTFKKITLNNFMLPFFKECFEADHRRSLLQRLRYDIVLPIISKNQTGFVSKSRMNQWLHEVTKMIQ